MRLHLVQIPSNEMIHRVMGGGCTYIVDDVRLNVLFASSLRVHGTDDVNLVVFIGHIASIHVDYVVSVVNAKPGEKQRRRLVNWCKWKGKVKDERKMALRTVVCLTIKLPRVLLAVVGVRRHRQWSNGV